mgnify:CR=1 FL=1
MELLKLILEITLPVLIVMSAIWGFFKLFYRFKSKFLLITNCQLLHKNIWKDISDRYDIKQNGARDFAFRPLVLLPHSLKKYSNIRNGHKAVLECINVHNEKNLKIIAEVFWIPENMKKWSKINHPVFSLVLRRYFGIERPMYQDEIEAKGKWERVEHHTKNLDALNKKVNDNYLQWAVSDKYTYRFFNPSTGSYSPNSGPDDYIEYCGLSIILRSYSFLHIEKDRN